MTLIWASFLYWSMTVIFGMVIMIALEMFDMPFIEALVWCFFIAPLSITVYLVLSPVILLLMMPVYINKVHKSYILRRNTNAK